MESNINDVLDRVIATPERSEPPECTMTEKQFGQIAALLKLYLLTGEAAIGAADALSKAGPKPSAIVMRRASLELDGLLDMLDELTPLISACTKYGAKLGLYECAVQRCVDHLDDQITTCEVQLAMLD